MQGRTVSRKQVERPATPRVVAMTMVRDESSMLRRWIEYYSRELGSQNLIVLDDNSRDGSTDDIPCTSYRLPAPPWKRGWAKTRAQLVNGIARGLLACNDVVIYTDVDEFLVADPDKYTGLVDYVARSGRRPVIAPLALEVMHNARVEPKLDSTRPLLSQRRFVKFSPGMCKPLLKRVPKPWAPAFHAIPVPFEVDPELWMLHLKYADEEALAEVAEHRRRVHEEEGRGHPASFWPMGAEILTEKLSSWTAPADQTGRAPEFTVREADLDTLVRQQSNGYWQADVNQVAGLDSSPLRELPERFRNAF